MNIIESGAKYSAIVGIGEKIRVLSQESGKDYLLLNRGVNSVCNIDLNSVVRDIDFNTKEMQVYPPSQGRPELRDAINKSYFQGATKPEYLNVCGGGMSALDLVFQTLDVERIFLPYFYWGSYCQVMTVRGKNSDVYVDFDDIENNLENYKRGAVVICDPNNPLGNKHGDQKLMNIISLLNDNGTVVIVDSPYRRIFCGQEDAFYRDLLKFQNVVIVESFSKSVGLSGQRLGFVHCQDQLFNRELGVRLMYATNGINAFSQILLTSLLTTEKGKCVVENFKKTTVEGIQKNISYLRDRDLLAEQFYTDSEPVGIFVIVKKSEQELLDKRIGSVSLSYFTRGDKTVAGRFSRICVSVPHQDFVRFFQEV